jgi:Pyruvate phosphate dikinase, AMP/ATP-binding domain
MDAEPRPPALIDQRLTLASFHSLAGRLGGHEFVKVVVEREPRRVHFIDQQRYQFHSDYVGEQILGIPSAEVDREIDRYNASFYLDPDRRFYIAMVSLHERFFALETVEIDTMDGAMIEDLYASVRAHLEPSLPLMFRPASFAQERLVAQIPAERLPRVLTHEIFSQATYLALNPGRATGRLRAFSSLDQYRDARPTLTWFDVLVMPRVPDDVPRVAGLVNAERTTPLSHPNVLAHGWGIPNAIQLGVLERVAAEGLDGAWVSYVVDPDASSVSLDRAQAPAKLDAPPWAVHRVSVDAPDTTRLDIERLDALRATDRDRFGTKAANLGELEHVLAHGSERLLGFFALPRPPRENLLPHLAARIGAPQGLDAAGLAQAAHAFLRHEVHTLRGVALPFAMQRAFLESCPAIQRHIGRLQMALELSAPQIDSACVELTRAIMEARVPDALCDALEAAVASSLSGARSLVVRSSSNAEDLEGFSAAGVYESVTHVTSVSRLVESVKRVWASLFSARSVRLRADVGIPLGAACMGVIVQEEVEPHGRGMGGVLVTSNPTAPRDFRNVYVNASLRSVGEVVTGAGASIQLLCNTVDGGSHGDTTDLDRDREAALERLAIVGRLLQSHFSPDFTYSAPLDIEWVWAEGRTFLLQVRPYGG